MHKTPSNSIFDQLQMLQKVISAQRRLSDVRVLLHMCIL